MILTSLHREYMNNLLSFGLFLLHSLKMEIRTQAAHCPYRSEPSMNTHQQSNCHRPHMVRNRELWSHLQTKRKGGLVTAAKITVSPPPKIL